MASQFQLWLPPSVFMTVSLYLVCLSSLQWYGIYCLLELYFDSNGAYCLIVYKHTIIAQSEIAIVK